MTGGPFDPAELVAPIATCLKVLVSRDGIRLSDALIDERARNIAMVVAVMFDVWSKPTITYNAEPEEIPLEFAERLQLVPTFSSLASDGDDNETR